MLSRSTMHRTHFRSFIPALAALFSLSGCVGLQTHTPTNQTSPATDGYRIDGTQHFWSQSEHPVNGTLTLRSEYEWCGAVLWAIVPLPLILPVCKSYSRVNFADGKPTTNESRGVAFSSFHGCGPGVWLATGIMHGRTASFCAAE